MNFKDKFKNFFGNKKIVIEFLVMLFFASLFVKYLGIPDKYDTYIYFVLFISFLIFLILYIRLTLEELNVILKERKDEE